MVVQEEPVLHIAVTLPAGITFWGKVGKTEVHGFYDAWYSLDEGATPIIDGICLYERQRSFADIWHFGGLLIPIIGTSFSNIAVVSNCETTLKV